MAHSRGQNELHRPHRVSGPPDAIHRVCELCGAVIEAPDAPSDLILVDILAEDHMTQVHPVETDGEPAEMVAAETELVRGFQPGGTF